MCQFSFFFQDQSKREKMLRIQKIQNCKRYLFCLIPVRSNKPKSPESGYE